VEKYAGKTKGIKRNNWVCVQEWGEVWWSGGKCLKEKMSVWGGCGVIYKIFPDISQIFL